MECGGEGHAITLGVPQVALSLPLEIRPICTRGYLSLGNGDAIEDREPPRG